MSSLSSRNPSAGAQQASQPRRSSSTRSASWPKRLSLLLAVVAVGCCSEPPLVTLTYPPIPAGKPADQTTELLKRERLWVEGGTELGDLWITLPAGDLDLILIDRARWKAWASALEVAWPTKNAPSE